ncbi:MAG: aldehyde dehydrogenase family protein [candidate division NC10 bacterium]
MPAWRGLGHERRAAILRSAAVIMRRRRFDLAALEVFEVGKPWREADADVAEAIDFCEYYARKAERMAVPRRVDVPGEENATIHLPRGVAVVIAPPASRMTLPPVVPAAVGVVFNAPLRVIPPTALILIAPPDVLIAPIVATPVGLPLPVPALMTTAPPPVESVEPLLKITLPAPPVLLPASRVIVCVVRVPERSTVAAAPPEVPTVSVFLACRRMVVLLNPWSFPTETVFSPPPSPSLAKSSVPPTKLLSKFPVPPSMI